jgi:multiple sugar transport system permease protein
MLFTSPINYIPLKPTLENYFDLFKTVDVGGMAWQTMVITGFSLIFSILFGLTAAYAFTRYPFKGSNMVLLLILFSAMLPMTSIIIPMFQFFRKLRLIDTFPGLVILYTSSLIPFTTLAFVNFLNQIPKSLEEAAEVDGAGTIRKIFLILIPVIKPAITTMAIINFISCMNEFMIPLIFSLRKVQTLSVGITVIPRVSQYYVPWEKISAMATLILIPIVAFVIIFERNIMEGIMAGSIKQ